VSKAVLLAFFILAYLVAGGQEIDALVTR